MKITNFQDTTSAQFRPLARKADVKVSAPSSNAPAPTESFQTSEAPPTLMQKVGRSLKPFNPLPLLESAAQTALHVATSTIPGAIGAAVSIVKDVATGGARNSYFEHKVDSGSEEAAAKQFEEAKALLLNPNEWMKLGPRFGPSSFQVYGQESGKAVEESPKTGDYLKIGLPDPFPHVWVQVEKIDVNDKYAEVVVRPSKNPETDSDAPAHLFSRETTNVFRVSREGNVVTSSVTGVNEKLNSEGSFIDKTISAARLMGAWAGAKKPQWNAFTKKLLSNSAPAVALQSTGMETALRVSSAAMNTPAS